MYHILTLYPSTNMRHVHSYQARRLGAEATRSQGNALVAIFQGKTHLVDREITFWTYQDGDVVRMRVRGFWFSCRRSRRGAASLANLTEEIFFLHFLIAMANELTSWSRRSRPQSYRF